MLQDGVLILLLGVAHPTAPDDVLPVHHPLAVLHQDVVQHQLLVPAGHRPVPAHGALHGHEEPYLGPPDGGHRVETGVECVHVVEHVLEVNIQILKL